VHVAEMLKVDSLTAELAAFKDWSRLPAPEPSPRENVASLDDYRPAATPRRSAQRPARSRLARIAAAVALLAVGAAYLGSQLGTTVVHTQAGESRRLTLEDGSVVRVLPGTDLRIQYRRRLRSVSIDQGRAIFEVAKDPSRPFVVGAARTQVQALGTVFSVQRRDESVVVAVVEGRVQVRSTGSPEPGGSGTPMFEPVALAANERVSVSDLGVASPIGHLHVESIDEWAQSQLEFQNARVGDVVEGFNRRNHVQIRITDADLAARTISGVFDGDDPESFVDVLETIAGASRITRSADEIIVAPAPLEPFD
jgi:transmembrane sensor